MLLIAVFLRKLFFEYYLTYFCVEANYVIDNCFSSTYWNFSHLFEPTFLTFPSSKALEFNYPFSVSFTTLT